MNPVKHNTFFQFNKIKINSYYISLIVLIFIFSMSYSSDRIKDVGVENYLQFKIKWPVIITGVANANMKNNNQYVGNTCNVWKGSALVVIKSAHGVEDIKLTATSHDLPDAEIYI